MEIEPERIGDVEAYLKENNQRVMLGMEMTLEEAVEGEECTIYFDF